jgi:hypothetical protein
VDQVAQNASTITQGSNGAEGGVAQAVGGNGGEANSGNTQILNGNSVSLAVGPNAKSDSQGGNTSAKSGDAQGGDGGNAKATGGDAKAGNVASVKQSSSSDGAKKSSEGSGNKSKVEQGENEAAGGPAQAVGGDGGPANSGNVQAFNGNSVSYAAGPKAKSESQGGDTSAKSGDAYGGNGGNAKASGGDAKAGNVAHVVQKSKSHGKKKRRPCDKVRIVKAEQSGGEANRSKVEQGEYNLAEGGPAEASGGYGGWADTGNIQEGNGNSFAKAESWQDGMNRPSVVEQCGCLPKTEKGPKASSEGGDTSAKSGDAQGGDGGDGGDAKATGGDAVAGNIAKVLQIAG